jgi:hypothetical protein
MSVAKIVFFAVAILGLASARISSNYDDRAAQGYRWVTTDGPYACPSKEDLRRITDSDTKETELEMIPENRAYYLLTGDTVQIVREETASDMSMIRVAGVRKHLWTWTRFLSKSPVEEIFERKDRINRMQSDAFTALGDTMQERVFIGEERDCCPAIHDVAPGSF